MPKVNFPYWACQGVGWGGYSALGFTIVTLAGRWHAGAAIGFGLFFLYSIALTHSFRGLIRRRGWLDLPASRGFPRIFGAAICVGLLLALLVIGLSHLLTGATSSTLPPFTAPRAPSRSPVAHGPESSPGSRETGALSFAKSNYSSLFARRNCARYRRRSTRIFCSIRSMPFAA